jgi:DNA-binding SARP family transcriptional activator
VWIDTWALERLCDDFDAAQRSKEASDDEALRRGYADELLALYRGPFLPDESEQPSYIACREQLRSRVHRFLARLRTQLRNRGAPLAAVECYQRCIEYDELCEPLYRSLMLWLSKHGEPLEALATYERLRSILSARLKLMPSAETQALYASLKAPGNPVTPC